MTALEEAVEALKTQPTISVAQAARVLGVGERAVRDAVRAGDIQALQITSNTRVLSEPLKKMLGMI